MFVDDDDSRQRQRLNGTRRVMVVKAAEADAPGWAATPTPSTSSIPTIKLVPARSRV